MSQNNTSTENNNAFLTRVFDNEAMRKGLAAAAAGALIAVVTEALWPSKS